MSSRHYHSSSGGDRGYSSRRSRSRSPDRNRDYRSNTRGNSSSSYRDTQQRYDPYSTARPRQRSPSPHDRRVGSSRSPPRQYRYSDSRHRERSRERYAPRSKEEAWPERRHGQQQHQPHQQQQKQQQQRREEEEEEEPKPLSRWERMEDESEEEQPQQQPRPQQPLQQQKQQLQQRRGPDMKQQQGRSPLPLLQQQQQQYKAQAAAAPAVPLSTEDSKALVLQMMKAPPGAAITSNAATAAAAAAAAAAAITQKHTAKELWTSKRDAAAAGVAAPYGANRWDLAEFNDEQQKVKFQRLLGVHKAAAAGLPRAQAGPEVANAPPGQAAGLEQGASGGGNSGAAGVPGPRVLTKDEQQRVLTDVERQFVAGLRRADGRTVGLGL